MSFNNTTKAGLSNSKASSSRKQMSDTSEDERPCFYKVLRDTEQAREIPKEFLKHISKDLYRTATFSVESGGSWAVQLILNGGRLFMDYGWAQFLRDNSLRKNMLLIFRYDGNMHFNVQVFDEDGLERIEASSNRIHTESARHPKGKRPPGRPRKYPLVEDGPGAGRKPEVLKATKKGKNVKWKSQDRNQSSSKVLEKRATSIPDQSTIKVEEG